ncbi:MAG: ABC transporter ATP-binding protein [Rhizobiales bacterium]|nr:ABC transporter ATP-binding protein [Hyphomicrobiales bacterium]
MEDRPSGAAVEVPRLAVEHLTKRFGALVANDDISLAVRSGELHCILGENGAGKSTLSSCLYGLLQPDEGRIAVDGVQLALASPLDAIRAGIGMVHQHFVLAPRFTVLENITVGTGSGFRLKLAAARRRLKELCSRYRIALDPDAEVADLSVGEQQWVEIVKALYLGARVLILDEPTAVLTPDESARLFSIIRELTATGISVVLITHKMNEVMQSDRVSVLRRGRLVATVRTAEVTRDELTLVMVGRPVQASHHHVAAARGGNVLEVEGVRLRRGGRDRLRDVSFRLAGGEILGIAGVSGNGQDELFPILAGIEPPSAGWIAIAGTPIEGLSAYRVAKLGVGYVPNDRFRDGLVPDFTIAENQMLGQQWEGAWRLGPFTNRTALAAAGDRAIRTYGIVAAGPETTARRLSGGNAQKVILAREFAKATHLLLCNQPTRGLDILVTEFVHAELLRKRDDGCAILLASEELDDLLALSDRIAVMFNGAILDILPREAAEMVTVARLMAGHRGPAEQGLQV